MKVIQEFLQETLALSALKNEYKWALDAANKIIKKRDHLKQYGKGPDYEKKLKALNDELQDAYKVVEKWSSGLSKVTAQYKKEQPKLIPRMPEKKKKSVGVAATIDKFLKAAKEKFPIVPHKQPVGVAA